MIPGCTNALDITLDDQSVDLDDAEDIVVTINQNGEQLDFTGSRIAINPTGYELSVYLTQEESLRFRSGPASCIVNWTYSDPTYGIARAATDPFTVWVGQQLYRRVMT